MSDFSGYETAQTADWSLSRLRREAEASLVFLTRLPIKLDVSEDNPLPPLAACVRGFPLAGLAVGLIAGAAAALAVALHLPPLAAAGLAIAASTIVTGGLHEDGLADVADGFWGGHSISRKLEIMKDSRIGSYGVLALALSLLIKAAAIAALLPLGPVAVIGVMMAAGAVSRAVIVPIMARLANVRPGGVSAGAGQPEPKGERAALLIGLAAGAVLLAFCAGLAAAAVGLAAAAAATFGMAALARRHIGGQTGDVCGAVQQVSELALLLAVAALAAP